KTGLLVWGSDVKGGASSFTVVIDSMICCSRWESLARTDGSIHDLLPAIRDYHEVSAAQAATDATASHSTTEVAAKTPTYASAEVTITHHSAEVSAAHASASMTGSAATARNGVGGGTSQSQTVGRGPISSAPR